MHMGFFSVHLHNFPLHSESSIIMYCLNSLVPITSWPCLRSRNYSGSLIVLWSMATIISSHIERASRKLFKTSIMFCIIKVGGLTTPCTLSHEKLLENFGLFNFQQKTRKKICEKLLKFGNQNEQSLCFTVSLNLPTIKSFRILIIPNFICPSLRHFVQSLLIQRCQSVIFTRGKATSQFHSS